MCFLASLITQSGFVIVTSLVVRLNLWYIDHTDGKNSAFSLRIYQFIVFADHTFLNLFYHGLSKAINIILFGSLVKVICILSWNDTELCILPFFIMLCIIVIIIIYIRIGSVLTWSKYVIWVVKDSSLARELLYGCIHPVSPPSETCGGGVELWYVSIGSLWDVFFFLQSLLP